MEPAPALLLLSQRLGMSPFERDTLLLCAAPELDTRMASLCARAQADANRPYPTFALALAIFDEPEWDALSPERPLRYWHIVEVSQTGVCSRPHSEICRNPVSSPAPLSTAAPAGTGSRKSRSGCPGRTAVTPVRAIPRPWGGSGSSRHIVT